MFESIKDGIYISKILIIQEFIYLLY